MKKKNEKTSYISIWKDFQDKLSEKKKKKEASAEQNSAYNTLKDMKVNMLCSHICLYLQNLFLVKRVHVFVYTNTFKERNRRGYKYGGMLGVGEEARGWQARFFTARSFDSNFILNYVNTLFKN